MWLGLRTMRYYYTGLTPTHSRGFFLFLVAKFQIVVCVMIGSRKQSGDCFVAQSYRLDSEMIAFMEMSKMVCMS